MLHEELEFRPINPDADRDTIIRFRKDSYLISFGSIDRFGEERSYIEKIRNRIESFPEGYVLVWYKGQPIGQIEMRIIAYEGTRIGYVHLYYLTASYRNKGFGKYLVNYAEAYFRNHEVAEYHLRVSPTNTRAVTFYEKMGMEKLKDEQHDYLVWRMKKNL
jgi:ribosomal protein S18 acetylase RimI-like enzyme